MIQKLKSQSEIDIKQAVLDEKEKSQEKTEKLNKKIALPPWQLAEYVI